jgi:hypothetical protein
MYLQFWYIEGLMWHGVTFLDTKNGSLPQKYIWRLKMTNRKLLNKDQNN